MLSKDELYVVGVSGRPRPLHSERISQNCDSQSTCDAAVRRWTSKVQGLVSAVKADSEEANTLEAIADGARSMTGTEGPKQIIVIDSGLQTAGELPLQTPGALANAEEIATLLHDNGRLAPALQGVRITFTGLGQVAAPQPDLPQEMRGSVSSPTEPNSVTGTWRARS